LFNSGWIVLIEFLLVTLHFMIIILIDNNKYYERNHLIIGRDT